MLIAVFNDMQYKIRILGAMKYKDQKHHCYLYYICVIVVKLIKYRPYWGLMEILKQDRIDSALTSLLVYGRAEMQQWTGLTCLLD